MKYVILFVLMHSGAGALMAQTIRYVKPDGPTPAAQAADATTWAAACADLQAVMNASSAGDEIWVAGGIYKPNRPANDLNTIDAGNRDNAFVLPGGVGIYGGFEGTETTLAERDLLITSNASTLSGDIGMVGDKDDNCYHVVISAGNTDRTLLDGFIITRAFSANIPEGSGDGITVNNTHVSRSRGGGINNANSLLTVSNCTIADNEARAWGGAIESFNSTELIITDCIIAGNTAEHGGGLFSWSFEYPSSSSIVTNCDFSGNTATAAGGAIVNNTSSSEITGCTFSDNTAEYAGAIRNYSVPASIITGCTFTDNAAEEGSGGALINESSTSGMISGCTFSGNEATGSGGAVYNHSSPDMTVTDCAFTGNISGMDGGGMFNILSSVTVTGCTFSDNEAAPALSGAGGGMANNSSSPSITSCIFSGNTASFGGGMYNISAPGMTIANCAFLGNAVAYSGGGMYNTSAFNMTVANCTFSGNTVAYVDGGIFDLESSLTVTNSIIFGNGSTGVSAGVTITYSLVQGQTGTGDGNIDATGLTLDDIFADASGGDYRLRAESPCRNAGNNGHIPPGITTDLEGNPRIQGIAVDMGAYEFNDGVLPLRLLDFTVKEAGCSAVAAWKTADETNVSHFELEESTDGLRFFPASDMPARNTPGNNSYHTAFTARPLAYYRLKMVDLDGTTAYSNIVTLATYCNNDPVTAYPNPARNMLYIGKAQAGGRYRIYDSSGRIVMEGMIGAGIEAVNVSMLSEGIYFLKTGSETVPFVKQ